MIKNRLGDLDDLGPQVQRRRWGTVIINPMPRFAQMINDHYAAKRAARPRKLKPRPLSPMPNGTRAFIYSNAASRSDHIHGGGSLTVRQQRQLRRKGRLERG